ncbi:MAG TPA: oxygenase MpaB family protein [Polyangiaceae bacterium]|nr:oxygenase MpaB family protein [Polyangiaceae bacterium]
MFPSRFVRLAEARARFGDRVDRLGAYLTRADPLADAVVETIEGMPPGAGAALFDRIVCHGPDALRDAPRSMQAFFDAVANVPAWVDWELVDRGGHVLLRAGPLGGLVLGFKSLVLAYSSPAGNKPLVFSGRLAQSAPRRLHETARFVRSTILPRSLRPRAEGWRATLRVRLVHARLRRTILRSGRWNASAWGLPINQHDEAGTLILFSAAVLSGLRSLGLHFRPLEVEAYMHLWRWSGWLMGIDPDLAPVAEGEANRLGELIALTQDPPDDDSRALTRAFLEAPQQSATTAARRRAARLRAKFTAAVCRMLIGDATADQLAIPPSTWRVVPRWLRRIVSAMERTRDAIAFPDEPAIRRGMAYWNRIGGEAEGP